MSPRRKLSDARRRQILKAAVQVIAEKGLCDTGIKDVADQAGTSPALVIYYFGKKDILLAEALSFADEQFYAQTAGAVAELASARDRLVELVRCSCSVGEADDDFDAWVLWLDLWARAPRDPDVARDRAAMDRRWRTTIGEIVREGQAAGGHTGASGEVRVVIRPERVLLEPYGSTGPNRMPAMVERLVYQGPATQLVVRLANGEPLQALIQNQGEPLSWEQGTAIAVHLPADALRVLRESA